MKKTLLAVAVAAFAATSASAAQVYDKDGTTLAIGGEMEAMYWSNYASGNGSQDGTVSDRARLNMDGRTQITDDIAAYGFYEWEIEHNGDSTEAQDVNARFAYLGVDFGKFGKLQFGRYEDPFQNASDVIDNLEETGFIGGLDERNSGHVSYMWEGYGFEAALSYQFAVDNYNADQFGTIDIDSGFSIYGAYTTPDVLFGPIAVRAGYIYLNAQDKREYATGTTTNAAELCIDEELFVDNIKSWDLGVSWGNMGEGFYVATNYNFSKAYLHDVDGFGGDITFKIWESMVSYGFDNGVVLSGGYSYVKMKADEYQDYEITDGTSKVWQLIASYDVNENFRFWVEGIFDAGTDDDFIQFYSKNKARWAQNDDGDWDVTQLADGSNAVLVGARYTF